MTIHSYKINEIHQVKGVTTATFYSSKDPILLRG